MYLFAMRRFNEAETEAKRAQQLDPGSSLVGTWAGYAEFLAGHVEEGTATLRRVLQADPTYSDASLALARAYVAQGKFEAAIVELQKALLFNQNQPLLVGSLAQAYARAGQREQALKLLGDLRRIEAEAPGYGPFGTIWAYEGLGEKDEAFAHLEKAYQDRSGRLVWLNVDPTLESLRSDARFEDLLRRIGLTRGPTQ
jgi:tetratricopeptide (TPR) repeat protein